MNFSSAITCITNDSLLFIELILLIIFAWRCWTVKRRPGLDKLVALIAYGGALNFASTTFLKSFKLCGGDQDLGNGLFIGAIVTLVGAAYGVYDLFKSTEPRFKPKKKT
jgi:hypothetical protein